MNGLTGRTFGPYQVLEEIGEGGMGVVYRGFQQSLNRYVAIKVLRPELAHHEQFIARFRQEALAVARLSHPNILHVYDAGLAHGVYYIVMDYTDGGSLTDLIRRGALETERAISITAQVAEALDHAHQQGLVHRDVKPSNVLLTRDGRPLLTDFGIARALHASTRLTRTGTQIGTPEYMAPEQAQGDPVDGRTDIYALGIVLYEMLAGWVPFQTQTPIATLYKQVNEPPPPLQRVNIRIPGWLEAAVYRALAKRPEDRYQRAGEFAQALRQRREPAAAEASAPLPRQIPVQMERHAPVAAARPVAPVRAKERAGRQRSRVLIPILAGAIAVLLLALLAGGGYLFLSGTGDESAVTDRASAAPPALGVPGASSTPVEKPTQSLLPTSTPALAPALVPASNLDTPTPIILIATDTPAPAASPTAPPTLAPTPLPTSEPDTPTPIVVPTDTPEPTAPPTVPPPTKPPAATRPPGIVTGFESFGTWKRGDEPTGTFTQSTTQVYQGSYSGKLDYHFDTASNDYVVFQQALPIAGRPTQISAWVYGDGSGHFLNAWIKDSDGQIWQVPLGRVTHTGWQQMLGILDVNQAWPWTHISGPDNGLVDYAISFYALVLDDRADPFTGSGTIYVDDMRTDANE